MFKYIIFDLDDTLLDFHRGEIEGIHKILEQQGIQDIDQGLQTYLSINKHVWEQIEKGVPSQKLLDTRFSLTFSKLGLTVDGKEIEKKYRSMLNHNFYTIDGAEQLLQVLKNMGLILLVGTNGVKKTQVDRLTGSGLDKYFDHYFISDDIGFNKPDIRFFSPIFKKYHDLSTNNAIMIGDSLKSDILGSRKAGLKNIWFNPNNNANTFEFKPTFEAHSYKDIEDILKK
ncbi:YjjG family noncanonical pyrimidine nucleotidase [Companilactobacillus insicii]|uniref:YjjG family noncanonical pyrimidine nucleotidase n=1 Tax=Companilactobacillus insicii TaxID=1732567 RepID=UPI000F77E4D9|nr:YjjG family noncanonical pyrimidine nucleotidase [Companilactobacillus insicii]